MSCPCSCKQPLTHVPIATLMKLTGSHTEEKEKRKNGEKNMKAEGEQLGRKRGSAEIGGSKGGYWGEYDQNIYTYEVS